MKNGRKSSVPMQLAPIKSDFRIKVETTSKMLKNSVVDFIIHDASDPEDKMPLDIMDVDRMITKGTYFSSQKFVSEESFIKFLRTNKVFGHQFTKDFYLYTIARQFAVKLKPSGYHKKNFPSEKSMVAICQSKYLIISPFPKNKDEKKQYFNTVKVDGEIIIDMEEYSSDDSIESHKNIFMKRVQLGVEEDKEEKLCSGE